MGPFAPGFQTVLAIVFVAGMVSLLGLHADAGTAESRRVVTSVPWLVWRVVGALAALVFVVLLLHGMRVLLDHIRRKPRCGWKRVCRWRSGCEQKPWCGGWLWFALLVGLSVGVLLLSGWLVVLASGTVGKGRLVLPVHDLDRRTQGLLLVGVIAAVPWLSLAWVIHGECRTIRMWAGVKTTRAHHDAVVRLGRLWKRIVACVTAFTVAVIGAMATTGVMRAVFLHAFPDRKSEFPAGYVLLYGFPFLIAVLNISVPLVAAWRSAAMRVLEHAVPIPDDLDLTDGWTNQRDRMTALLRLDVSLVRSPLTVLSTVTPLVFTLLAAFLPDLAIT